MAAVKKPHGIKLKAWVDDVLIAPVLGRRMFTKIITDKFLKTAIRDAKKARGGSLTPNAALLKSAAKSFNTVHRAR
ncbi:hypothetical protein [Gemmobacter nectariphilus]|uniref:hypothetical protein n=1 Tax=Gemmobacter nectariphilus TaxID=220343 RepID=UPI000426E966|nr:hypothetical protein [Gemmobacter nectariphilus]